MIPLVYFMFAWLVLVAIFAIVALITVLMALRFGLSGPMTTLATAIFVGVAAAILIVTGSYLIGIDWTQNVGFTSSSASPYSL